MLQRGLEIEALRRRLHFALHAERAHGLRIPRHRLEITLIGREVQDAALQVVVAQPELAAQGAQAFAAVAGEPGEGQAVALEATRPALAEEAQPPLPLRPAGTRAEKQRRVLAPEPTQDLRHHGGLRPGLGVPGGDLAAVGERGFEGGRVVPLDHRHFVACGGEVPGAGNADHAGAENDDFHRVMIAPCLSSPSASGASSCSANTITWRTTQPLSATSRSTTTSTSGSRS